MNLGQLNRIFDSHFHIIDPNYPLIPNQGFLPESFTVKDYLEKTADLNIAGGAVISGSFHGFDQNYLVAALEKLGPQFVGVTQLSENISDEEILKLQAFRVRAVRFNLYRGGSETLRYLQSFANRIFDLAKWHIELYVDSKDLPDLYSLLIKLPKVSIDHLGLSQIGFKTLLKLAENNVRVKASGFMRVDFDVEQALKRLFKANCHALMFGTDLPGTRAKRQFSMKDIELIQKIFSEDEQDKIFWKNAALFYGL